MANKVGFIKHKTAKEIEDLYNFNVEVFSDGVDFSWSLDNLKEQSASGWSLYAAKVDKEIIAVLFAKEESAELVTKHTPIKLEFRGNGYSHQIKDFFEELAKDESIKTIKNICRGDDFRMISLNETHDYKKTGKVFEGGKLVEWQKHLK